MGGGTVRLLKGAPVFKVNDEMVNRLDIFRKHSAPAERFTYKCWVVAVIGTVSDEQGMRDLATSSNLLGLPFFLGVVSDIETLRVDKCMDKDKHKPKEAICDAQIERRCLSKTGNQIQKAIELVQCMMSSCAVTFTNMTIEAPRRLTQ